MNTCMKCLKDLEIPVVGNAKTLPFQEEESDDLYDQETEEQLLHNLMYDNPLEEH